MSDIPSPGSAHNGPNPGSPRPSVTDDARAEPCNCATFSSAAHCPHHTQADYEAAARAETTTEHEHKHDWKRQRSVTSKGYELPTIDVCQTEGCDAARPAETTTDITEDALAIRDRLLLDALAYIEREGLSPKGAVQAALRMGAEAGLLATARTRPTRTIYSVQHWEDADGIRASWVTGYGQYTHSREDAEATLRHQERQHPDTTFRLAQAEVTAWTEADRSAAGHATAAPSSRTTGTTTTHTGAGER